MGNTAKTATIEEKRGLYDIVVAAALRNIEHEGGMFADDLFWAAREMARRDPEVREKGPVKININNKRGGSKTTRHKRILKKRKASCG